MRHLLPILASLALLQGACSQDTVVSITRELKFTLDIGQLEDQIAIYNLGTAQGIRIPRLTMRDGLFYIADGEGKKVLRYDSYGDILFMIYNDETNPPPINLKPLPETPNEIVTRWFLTYPLEEPGRIIVNSRKHIYVEDRLPDERHGFDPQSKATLDRVILHFDENGRFVEYLGREGVGGSPFPRIEGIYTSVEDELAVVCRIPTGWTIYWFNVDGMAIYEVKIENDATPVQEDRDMFGSLDTIAVAPDARKLYIKVDYYRDIHDESTNTQVGNDPDSSVIWVMKVEDGGGVYEKSIDIPFFELTFTENNRKVSVAMFYSLMGIIRDEQIFLYFPVENGYSLLILDSDTREQHRGFIEVQADELQYNTFSLSQEGILSAMLVRDLDVEIVWWRTDKFLGAL
jgi:hypothetical protein